MYKKKKKNNIIIGYIKGINRYYTKTIKTIFELFLMFHKGLRLPYSVHKCKCIHIFHVIILRLIGVYSNSIFKIGHRSIGEDQGPILIILCRY